MIGGGTGGCNTPVPRSVRSMSAPLCSVAHALAHGTDLVFCARIRATSRCRNIAGIDTGVEVAPDGTVAHGPDLVRRFCPFAIGCRGDVANGNIA